MRRSRRRQELGIHPIEAVADPALEITHILVEGLSRIIFGANNSAKDRPSLKIATGGLLQISSEFIDAANHVRRGENVGAPLSPAIYIALAKIRVLEQTP